MADSPSIPVDLVIRFTASIPDLVLNIASPSSTTTLSLKRLIRKELPTNLASSRLRLISAGKVLSDTTALSASITLPPPPKARKDDFKGKGKAIEGSVSTRIYIHCSVGEALGPEDLLAEEAAAIAADAALSSKSRSKEHVETPKQDGTSTKMPPAARGFDRLLNAGFTAAEVATLRAQFLAIQAHTHTPDTMPTGEELHVLEDRWLDNEAGGNAETGAAGGTGEGRGGFGAEDGGLEDMLWGNIMGFFWPVAAVCWLMREEGVWSRRRQIAVLSGMLVNLTFGFLRLAN